MKRLLICAIVVLLLAGCASRTADTSIPDIDTSDIVVNSSLSQSEDIGSISSQQANKNSGTLDASETSEPQSSSSPELESSMQDQIPESRNPDRTAPIPEPEKPDDQNITEEQFKDISSTFPTELYGGYQFYVDNTFFVIIFVINQDAQKTIEGIVYAAYPKATNINFKYADYSVATLERVYNTLLGRRDYYGFDHIEYYLMNNRVHVFAKKVSPELLDFMNTDVDGGCVEVTEGTNNYYVPN